MLVGCSRSIARQQAGRAGASAGRGRKVAGRRGAAAWSLEVGRVARGRERVLLYCATFESGVTHG